MVVTGALLLAAKGIFAKLLYTRGVSVEALLVIRALIALPLIWGWAVFRIGLRSIVMADRRAIRGALLAGLIGYYVGAWLDFRALQLIDASLERALLFAYPVFVVIARAALSRTWPGRRMTVAVLSTYLGVILAVGGFDVDIWRANALGAALVMMTAVLFAYYLLANEHGASNIGSAAFLVYSMTSAAIGLSGHFLTFGELNELTLDGEAWLLIIVMTLATYVLPLFMISEGVKRIGAQRTAIISTVGPPATIIMGVTILGERVSPTQLLGTVFIVGGIVVLETRLAQSLLRRVLERTSV